MCSADCRIHYGADRRYRPYPRAFWNAVLWRYAPAPLSAATRDAVACWLRLVLDELRDVHSVVVLCNDRVRRVAAGPSAFGRRIETQPALVAPWPQPTEGKRRSGVDASTATPFPLEALIRPQTVLVAEATHV